MHTCVRCGSRNVVNYSTSDDKLVKTTLVSDRETRCRDCGFTI